jgi:hypothetical protein
MFLPTTSLTKAQAKAIRSDWHMMPAANQQGLQNHTGVICYRLSLFQSLFHQPRFANWLVDYHQPERCVSDSRDGCASCCLRDLIIKYWDGTKGQGILKQLLKINSLFKDCKSYYFPLPRLLLLLTLHDTIWKLTIPSAMVWRVCKWTSGPGRAALLASQNHAPRAAFGVSVFFFGYLLRTASIRRMD